MKKLLLFLLIPCFAFADVSSRGNVNINSIRIPGTNILPNTQWKIATALGSDTQYNVQGTGTETVIAVTGYTTASNSVTVTTTTNANLAVGDLISFQTGCDANLRISASRVLTIPDGTHFTITLPRNLTASVSASCNAVITNSGGITTGGSGDSFDGWSKSTTAYVWREYHSANVLAGSKYSAAFLKKSAGAETMSYTPPAQDISIFPGRTVVFGAWVRQKIKGGAGTWRLYISSNGTNGTTRYSSSATSTAYTWAEVSYTIPTDATTVSFGFSADGAINDVYYISQPMAGFGNYLGSGNYVPRVDEYVQPKVKYSPATYIGASVTFPSVLNNGDYNFQIDFYAETNGAIAPGTKRLYINLEGKNPCAAQTDMALRDVVAAPIKYYGVLNCHDANNSPNAGILTLDTNGYAVMYSSVSGAAWTLVSIDINGMWP